jgi:hypothetical protein
MYCHRRNWFDIKVDFENINLISICQILDLLNFVKVKDWARSMKHIKVGKNNSKSIDLWTSFLEISTQLYRDFHSSILILWQYSSRYNELYNRNKPNKDHNIPTIITTFLYLQVIEITSFTKDNYLTRFIKCLRGFGNDIS